MESAKPKPKNEFDEIETEEEAPEAFSTLPPTEGSLVSENDGNLTYDWSKAPDVGKAPPRIDLDGKVITIKKSDIRLPPVTKDWELSKTNKREYKYCQFILYYDIGGQVEFLSGVRVFKRDVDGKYSHPSITRDRKNQASALLGLYADFKKKDINEVSLREFMGFLNSNPKAKIKVSEVINPNNGQVIKKNLIGEFVSQ